MSVVLQDEEGIRRLITKGAVEEGVLEGRKTFGNVMKYLKMSVSGNFGNMIAVIVASIFLPFLPMLPSPHIDSKLTK